VSYGWLQPKAGLAKVEDMVHCHVCGVNLCCFEAILSRGPFWMWCPRPGQVVRKRWASCSKRAASAATFCAESAVCCAVL